MSRPTLPRRRTLQPLGAAGPDWANPLTNGLLVLGNYSPLLPSGRANIIGKGTATPFDATTVRTASARGMAVRFVKTDFNAAYTTFSDMPVGASALGTFFVLARHHNSGDTGRSFFAGALGKAPAGAAILRYSDTVLVTTTNSVAQGELFAFVGTKASANEYVGVLNGVVTRASPGDFGWPTSINLLGGETAQGASDVDVYMYGQVDRPWSEAECISWCQNPWQLFARPQRKFFAAAVAGGAELAGNAAGIATAAGALTTQINMAGAAVSVATAAGALTTGIPLFGAAAGVVSASGNLTTLINFNAAAVMQALAAGALTTGIPLAGAASGAVLAAGGLTTGIPLAGAAAGVVTAAADLTIQIRLNGAAVAVALAQGDLTTGGANALAGAASGIASASGALTTQIPLLGAALNVTTASGALSTGIPLGGAAASVTGAIGSLDAVIRLNAQALISALAQGNLTATIKFDGAALQRALAAGSLSGGSYTPAPAWRSTRLARRSRVVRIRSAPRKVAA